MLLLNILIELVIFVAFAWPCQAMDNNPAQNTPSQASPGSISSEPINPVNRWVVLFEAIYGLPPTSLTTVDAVREALIEMAAIERSEPYKLAFKLDDQWKYPHFKSYEILITKFYREKLLSNWDSTVTEVLVQTFEYKSNNCNPSYFKRLDLMNQILYEGVISIVLQENREQQYENCWFRFMETLDVTSLLIGDRYRDPLTKLTIAMYPGETRIISKPVNVLSAEHKAESARMAQIVAMFLVDQATRKRDFGPIDFDNEIQNVIRQPCRELIQTTLSIMRSIYKMMEFTGDRKDYISPDHALCLNRYMMCGRLIANNDEITSMVMQHLADPNVYDGPRVASRNRKFRVLPNELPSEAPQKVTPRRSMRRDRSKKKRKTDTEDKSEAQPTKEPLQMAAQHEPEPDYQLNQFDYGTIGNQPGLITQYHEPLAQQQPMLLQPILPHHHFTSTIDPIQQRQQHMRVDTQEPELAPFPESVTIHAIDDDNLSFAQNSILPELPNLPMNLPAVRRPAADLLMMPNQAASMQTSKEDIFANLLPSQRSLNRMRRIYRPAERLETLVGSDSVANDPTLKKIIDQVSEAAYKQALPLPPVFTQQPQTPIKRVKPGPQLTQKPTSKPRSAPIQEPIPASVPIPAPMPPPVPITVPTMPMTTSESMTSPSRSSATPKSTSSAQTASSKQKVSSAPYKRYNERLMLEESIAKRPEEVVQIPIFESTNPNSIEMVDPPFVPSTEPPSPRIDPIVAEHAAKYSEQYFSGISEYNILNSYAQPANIGSSSGKKRSRIIKNKDKTDKKPK